MNSPATIVLPVHNLERTLRPVLVRILELAEITARRLQVVVVDDGSTDGTFEAACEMARQFPQISVLRQPYRGGLRAALDQVRRRVNVDQAIVHDGVTPIVLRELEALLAAPVGRQAASKAAIAEAPEGRGSRRFAGVAALHARLAEAHRSIGSFRWLHLEELSTPGRVPAPCANSWPNAAAAIAPEILPA